MLQDMQCRRPVALPRLFHAAAGVSVPWLNQQVRASAETSQPRQKALMVLAPWMMDVKSVLEDLKGVESERNKTLVLRLST